LFSGLLSDARGGSYIAATRLTRRGKERPRIRVLIPQGGGHSHTFPLPVFEAAVLSCLREIKPHDILNGDHEPDDTEELAGRLTAVEDELAKVRASLDRKGYSETLDDRARKLEDDKRALAADLADARLRAAHPLSEAWGEAHGLIDALANSPDPADARLRLRAKLREIVAGVWLMVVPRGQVRLLVVQIWFAKEKKHRDYLIMQRPPRANARARVDGGWWAASLSHAIGPRDLDLRDAGHVAGLAAALEQVPLDDVRALLAGGPAGGG
jgi:hypothetical protein